MNCHKIEFRGLCVDACNGGMHGPILLCFGLCHDHYAQVRGATLAKGPSSEKGVIDWTQRIAHKYVCTCVYEQARPGSFDDRQPTSHKRVVFAADLRLDRREERTLILENMNTVPQTKRKAFSQATIKLGPNHPPHRGQQFLRRGASRFLTTMLRRRFRYQVRCLSRIWTPCPPVVLLQYPFPFTLTTA